MNYQRYLKICEEYGYTGQRRDQLARTVLLPRAAHLQGNPHVMPNLRALPELAAHPELWRVPARRLKRWANRAVRETVPRERLLHGPRLLASRQRRRRG